MFYYIEYTHEANIVSISLYRLRNHTYQLQVSHFFCM